MRTVSLLLSVLTISLFLFCCSKEGLNIIDGTYTGTYTASYKTNTDSTTTTLKLKNGKYSCFGNSSKISTEGSGTYSTENGKITFNDQNTRLAIYDPNFLNGQYNYSFDGKKLIISKKLIQSAVDEGYLEYNLKKY
jgi:hypothetical protein